MSILITFLSGKGGSGKTTLALSMADLLYRCGVKTLLVDCDMSTNGASYFYESLLMEKSRNKRIQITSFFDLLHIDIQSKWNIVPLEVKEKLDFIPSVAEISEEYLEKEGKSEELALRMKRFVEWVYHDYEIALFDCQAGYTELLSALLPLMDIDLFVIEADSISASSMRSLHLKIGKLLGHARIYQIFNKATEEEFDIYSKIVGTFFTNIGTLLFDWKIRQAFSRSQIPDLENISERYGEDLCSICRILFTNINIQEKLERFSDKLLFKRVGAERIQVKKKIDNLVVERRLYSKKQTLRLVIFTAFLTVNIFLLLFILNLLTNNLLLESERFVKATFVSSGFAVIMSMVSFIILDRPQGNIEERQKYEQRLEELDRELEKMERIEQNRFS